MRINKPVLRLIKGISKGSKEFEKLKNKRAVIADSHYMDLTLTTLKWAIRCAQKNPEEQVCYIENGNPDKLSFMLRFLKQLPSGEFMHLDTIQNLFVVTKQCALVSDDETDDIVMKMKKLLNKNRKVSKNGGVIVLGSLDEAVFPYRPDNFSNSKTILPNLEKLTSWHKYDGYSLVMGTCTTPVPKKLQDMCGGYWDVSEEGQLYE